MWIAIANQKLSISKAIIPTKCVKCSKSIVLSKGLLTRCNILSCMIFHHPKFSNLNTCPTPLSHLAKWCTAQKSILNWYSMCSGKWWHIRMLHRSHFLLFRLDSKCDSCQGYITDTKLLCESCADVSYCLGCYKLRLHKVRYVRCIEMNNITWIIINCSLKINKYSDRSRISQSGGRQSRGDCAELSFGKIFDKSCIKMKQFGPRRGRISNWTIWLRDRAHWDLSASDGKMGRISIPSDVC